MITVAKATSAAYYTDGDGGGGMESYYLDAVTEGEPAGRWAGSGAALLGLEGEVDADDMETLFEDFVNPVDGRALGLRPANRVKAKEMVAAALAAEPGASRERRAQIRAEVASQVRASVIGWDLTFAVPKSVTVLHTAATRGQIAAARAGDAAGEAAFGWIRAQIDEAIRVANAAGLRAAEAVTTARVGGGAGGAVRWERAVAVVFASFYQHTSRSIEPHLHVHNVALNKVLCGDGRWRAIDGQDLLAQRYAFSAVADRALIEYLAGLGLGFRDRPDGAGKEADLVCEAVMDHFSTRHHQMDAKLAPLTQAFTEKYGREPTSRELSQLKTYAQRSSRAGKAHGDQTADELNEAWVADLKAEVGHDLEATGDALLRAVLSRMPAALREALPEAVREAAEREALHRARAGSAAVAAQDGSVAGVSGSWSPETVIAKAVAGCAARSATWGRANLQLEISQNLPVLGIDPDQVQELLETLTDQAVTGAEVVQVTGLEGADVEAGVPWYAAPSATLYAAAGTLAAEEALRAAAVTRGRFALDRAAVAGWLDAYTPTIGADQRAAVEGIASSDAAVAVLVGPAGTGKSFAAGALANAWSDLTGGGGRVIGLAVSQVAADVLRDDGIPLARNVAKWLATQERLEQGRAGEDDRPWALRARDVVLVDEASMVGTAALEAVRARVEAAGARLLLAGDPRQLGAVEAGGVMGLLEQRAETYTLTEVRRFRHKWERGASLALRDGAADALDEYDRHARLVEYPTMEQAVAGAARTAVADRVAGRSTVVVTVTNDQAAAVAAKVRDQLIDLGLVAPVGGVLTGRDGNTAGVGDIVMCRRNDYTLGVTNRVQYRVVATGTGIEDGLPEGALVVEPLTPGPAAGSGAGQGDARVVLPAQYVAVDVQLGYAATVYAAQGLTVQAGDLVAGGGAGLDAAALYVAMTRGRDRNTAHVALATPGKPSAPAAATPGGGQVRLEDTSAAPTARAVLEAGLTDPATAGLRQLPASGTAATVAAEHDAARARSMATLTARLEAETRTACRARLERQLDDLAAAGILDEDTRARLAADQASEHLSRLLRVVETDGRDPARVLQDAVTRGRSLTDADSPAQVLAHRITRGRPDHTLTGPTPVTGSAVPAGIPAPVAARLADLHARAAARAVELGRLTAQAAPEWAVQALGPVPPTTGTTTDTTGAEDAAEDGTADSATDSATDAAADVAEGVAADGAADRADWERRAGLVAAHREAVGYTDPVRALPSMPGLTSTERRAGYVAAWQALGRPETDLTEAAMSQGRLRIRVQAWEREQAWAPGYVDDALRAAETDLQAARQAAALAAARADQAAADGDPERAAKWRDEADEHERTAQRKAAAVAGLTRQAETHTAWVAHTIVTRDLAERARAEADRRGLDLDTPPADTTTAREWLAAHAAAIAAEDAWRPITETDLTDDAADDAAAGEDGEQDRLRTTGVGNRDAKAAPATASTAADQHAGTAGNATDQCAAAGPGTVTTTTAATVPVGEMEARPDLSMAELELMTAGAAAVQAVLADRDNQEAAHTAAVQADLAIEAAEAGRRRRELADLDAALAAGHPEPHTALSLGPDGTTPDDAALPAAGDADDWAD